MGDVKLLKGDCIEKMREIEDNSIDSVITDPPYGTTGCSWDRLLNHEEMWKELKRITKHQAAIVLFSNQPYTTDLISSNIEMFKYTWVWIKNRPTLYQHAKNRPMGKHEDICVFSKAGMGHASLLKDNRMKYNPVGVKEEKKTKKVGPQPNYIGPRDNQNGKEYEAQTGYPSTVLNFNSEIVLYHPTQKPVALLEFLVKTYTDENETILDFTMGSGSTGVAASLNNRNFVGIELDENYFQIAEKRIKDSNVNLNDFFS